MGVPPGETKPFRTRRRGFTTRKEAWKSYMLMKARAAEGIFPDRKKGANKEKDSSEEISANSTVNEYFTVYWQGYLTRGNASTTLDKTLGYFNNHILPTFGETPLKKITPLICRNFAADLKKEYASARQILTYFKSFFEDAVKMKILAENPLEHVRIPTKTEVLREKKIAGEEDVFFSNYYSRDELIQFLAFSKVHCSLKKDTLFVLLAHSGLRRGEAFALRWSDIDFNKKTISVNKSAAHSKEQKLHIKDTKNYISRKVTLDDATLDQLLRWKTLQQQQLLVKGQYAKNDKHQYIFQNKYNELTNPSEAGRWLSDLFKKCDIKKITVHGLRHTHCTLALQSRAYSVEEIMHRMGHKDIKTTMEVYTHVTEETMEDNPAAYMNFLSEAKNARQSA